jgi:hypothetical protein
MESASINNFKNKAMGGVKEELRQAVRSLSYRTISTMETWQYHRYSNTIWRQQNARVFVYE